jgi:ketosteroid isomerase-like protein
MNEHDGRNDSMTAPDRTQIVRECFAAYESGERAALDRHLAPDLRFYSPPDPGLNRAEYFERCWPNAGNVERFEFIRLLEHDDEVVATYEAARPDGSRFRNTEVFTFAGDQLRQVEVYFGCNL